MCIPKMSTSFLAKGNKFLFLTTSLSFLITINALGQGGDEPRKSEVVTTPESQLAIQQPLQNLDLYTGAANVTIPLFTLKQGDVEIPINLIYNSNGIQVTDNPTWVGLGWTLTQGGTIVRQLNGYEDEKGLGGYSSSTNPSANLYSLNDAIFDNINSTPSTNNEAYSYYLRTRGAYFNTGVDLAPDVFHFSVLGRSGRIMFDGNAVPYSDSNLKIEVVRTSIRITTWTLTFDDGLKCVFNQLEQVNDFSNGINSHGNTIGGEPGFTDIIWHLTDVFTPGNTDHITFQYESDTHNGQIISRFEKYLVQNISNSTCSDLNSYKNYNFMSTISTEKDYKIKWIIGSLYKVEFVRDQLTYSRFQTCLKRLNIYAADTRIRSYDFEYKQYGNRFQLLSVQEVGSSVAKLPAYTFSYDETVIPEYTDSNIYPSSAGIDHWGYYNGTQLNQTQIPSAQVENLALGQLTPMDRTPNPAYMQAGILKKFKLPTGGVIEFTYAPGTFSYFGDGTRKATDGIGGGLCVTAIREKRSESDEGIVTSYIYQDAAGRSSGVINKEPYYHYNFALAGNSYHLQTDGQFWLDVPLEDYEVRYRYVKEYRSGGHTLYTYNTRVDHVDPSSLTDESFLFIYMITTNTMTFQRLDHPVVNGLTSDYPMWGTLKSKQVFGKQANLITTEEFNYDYQLIKSFPSRKIIGIDSWGWNRCEKFPGTFWFFQKFNFNLGKTRLSSKLTKFKSEDNQELFESESLLYSTANDRISSISKTLSNGESLRTDYYYSGDYNNTNLIFSTLKDQNIISALVEKKQMTNNKLVEHSVHSYSSTGKLLNTYTRKWNNTMNEAELPFNSDGPQLTSDYYKIVSFQYDDRNRIINVSNLNGSNKNYRWDDTGNYILAEIQNPSQAESFSTSFEDATGNSLIGEGLTGEKCRIGGYTKNITGLIPGIYLLSFWSFIDSQWVYSSEDVTVDTNTYTLTLLGKVDEVRFHPKTSLMTTFTHKPGIGITSTTRFNSTIEFKEFDEFGRLILQRDTDRNIIKKIDFNFKND